MLAAFLLKAAIPAGYMPGAGSDGYTTLVICGAMGEKTVRVPIGDAAPSQEDHMGDKACAYHLAGMQKILLSAPPVIIVPQPTPDAPVYIFPRAVLLSENTLSYDPRGPPRAV